MAGKTQVPGDSLISRFRTADTGWHALWRELFCTCELPALSTGGKSAPFPHRGHETYSPQASSVTLAQQVLGVLGMAQGFPSDTH